MGKPDAPPQWTGKSIRKLSLHKRRVNPMNLGYGLEHIPFLFLYAYRIPFVKPFYMLWHTPPI
ncbi:Putative ATPase, partial [Phytophthora palmivora]